MVADFTSDAMEGLSREEVRGSMLRPELRGTIQDVSGPNFLHGFTNVPRGLFGRHMPTRLHVFGG
jgi:hypothetical protein